MFIYFEFKLIQIKTKDSHQFLKILRNHWLRKYKSAKTYINDRLDILYDEGVKNFEFDIYNASIIHRFLMSIWRVN